VICAIISLIICGDRLTIDEVLHFVTDGAFFKRTKTKSDLLAMAAEGRSHCPSAASE